MSRNRPRAIGEFCWLSADVGVECLSCGRVAVYCDWEASACFRERGWSTAVGDAIKRFRCRCGSRDLRFRPVPIGKRPKPIPTRPAALRAIYAEDARALSRRGPSEIPNHTEIQAALDVVRAALACRSREDVRGAELSAALATLRPHCYTTTDLDGFEAAVAPNDDALHGSQAAGLAFTGILRQLGRPPE